MDPGSSPLTRGKREDRAREVLGGGLIPAHAGKTSPAAPSLSHRRAHPRSRGENRGQHGDDLSVLGSSPLTRGKLLYLGFTFRPLRLIPAHAGKTLRSSGCSGSMWAHPRSRGENSDLVEYARASGGSSPLTRGKHFLTCAFTAQIGQILESLELCASSESYSSPDAYATDAP